MTFLGNLAYGAYLGPCPIIAIVGFLAYTNILAAAILASGKLWSKRLRHVPVKVHRGLGVLAILLATLHLLMGVSAYV